MAKMKVIDVSYWNGNLSVKSYKKLKKKGIDAVIARCGGYVGDMEDSKFSSNISHAKSADLAVGAYYYSGATSVKEAKIEAKHAVKLCKGKGLKYPIFMDVEDNKTILKQSHDEIKEMIYAFCEAVEDAGFTAGVYASYAVLIHLGAIKYPVWVAQYNSRCSYGKEHVGWQFTSSWKPLGSVRFDVSWFYKNYGGTGKKSNTSSDKKAYSGSIKLPVRGYFKKGDKGSKVTALQKGLVWAGFTDIHINGKYDGKMVSVVEGFEQKYGLDVDGEFGKKCLAKFKTVKR